MTSNEETDPAKKDLLSGVFRKLIPTIKNNSYYELINNYNNINPTSAGLGTKKKI